MAHKMIMADIEVLTEEDSAINKCVDEIKASGLKHVVGPSSTTVEGKPDDVWCLLRRIHELAANHSKRAFTNIKIREVEGWTIDSLMKTRSD